MATANKPRQCKQAPLCKIATDGKCIEGLDVAVCPHILEVNEPTDQTAADKQTPQDPGTKLLSGEELKLEDVHQVSNNYATKRIFVIGESDSGKTTLLVRLYNSF